MYKKNACVFICGLLFSLGFAPFDLWLISIFAVSLLIFFAEGLKPRHSFYLGYWFGFGMWLSGISWLYVSIHYHGNISEIGSALLILVFVAVLALYSGLTILIYNFFRKHAFGVIKYLALPVAWVTVEIARSYLFTGFPWLISGTMLGDSFIDGFTPIIGAQGNSFFLIFASTLIYSIGNTLYRKKLALPQFIFLCLILVLSITTKQLQWTKEIGEINVSLHQPNLTLKDKWSQFGLIKTQRMIYKAIQEAEIGELIVFPETALIISEKNNADFINEINQLSHKKNLILVTGIVEREGDNKIRNRLRFLGSINEKYDKIKLVPFGEFIPLETYLGNFLDILGLKLTNTIPGNVIRPAKSGKLSISPSICYEIAFDNLIRKTSKDSNLLLTVSNDTWFGMSIGPIQHLQIAQNRALEHKKPLIRSTNSGISAFISKDGKILEKQGYFVEKTLNRKVILYSGTTFYTNWGNLPMILFLLTYLAIVLSNKFYFKTKT